MHHPDLVTAWRPPRVAVYNIKRTRQLLGEVPAQIDKDIRPMEGIAYVLAVFNPIVFLVACSQLLSRMHRNAIVRRYTRLPNSIFEEPDSRRFIG